MTDGWGIESAVATSAAAIFAAWAIWQSKRDTEKSRRDIIAERRADFELRLLADLARVNELGDPVSDAEFQAVASILPVDLVPRARDAVGLSSTDDASAAVDAAVSTGPGIIRSRRAAARDLVRQEVRTAIESVLSRRGTQ